MKLDFSYDQLLNIDITLQILFVSKLCPNHTEISTTLFHTGGNVIYPNIPSTVNIENELIITAIWTAKSGLVSGRLACKSIILQILRNVTI